MWLYEVCPESIRPFWISREPVAWPWYNSAASQRDLNCASVNSHSPVGLVSRQWDAVDWVCVLCDRRVHKSPPFQRRFQPWEKPEVAGRQMWSVRGLTDLGDVMLCRKSLHESCRMCRRIVVMKLICSVGHFECDCHTAHKLSQRWLTADWLASRESVYGCTVRSALTGCQVTSRPRERFSRYSKWTDNLRTSLVYVWYIKKHMHVVEGWKTKLLKH